MLFPLSTLLDPKDAKKGKKEFECRIGKTTSAFGNLYLISL